MAPVDKNVSDVESAEGAAVFSPERQALVNESWILMKKDVASIAVSFFMHVLELAPTAKNMFSFLRDSDVPLEKNLKLKPHAVSVLKTTGDAATQLGEKGGLDAMRPALIRLARSHVGHGVIDAHFEVVKKALLMAIEEAKLPGLDSVKLIDAWSAAFDALAGVIKEEMHRIRSAEEIVKPTL